MSVARFRTVNPDNTVRQNYDSDQNEGIFIVPPVVRSGVSPVYRALRNGRNGMTPSGKHFEEDEFLIAVRSHKFESADALLAAWDVFCKEFDRIGKIEYRVPNASFSYFIDHYYSRPPSLHVATRFPWWEEFEIGEPIIVSVTAHPEVYDEDGIQRWL